MNNVIDLTEYRNKHRNPYKNKIAIISTTDYQSLLAQFMEFKRERTAIGKLTPALVSWGIPLFTELNKKAINFEFKTFTGTYLKHLQNELKNSNTPTPAA